MAFKQLVKSLLKGFARLTTLFIPSKSTREYVRDIVPAKIYHKLFIKDSIFLSVGDACKTALHLKASCLRQLSAPLDYMMCYTLQDAHRLFESDFADFFAECYRDEKGQVVDTKNGMISIHHFPDEVPVQQYLPSFQCIWQRRVKRMKTHIIGASRVVFVCSRADDLKSLTNFAIKMQKLLESPSFNGGGGNDPRNAYFW